MSSQLNLDDLRLHMITALFSNDELMECIGGRCAVPQQDLVRPADDQGLLVSGLIKPRISQFGTRIYPRNRAKHGALTIKMLGVQKVRSARIK